jgi:hypothetical protein
MITVEKSFEKKYPIGNDFFSIVHFPKYSSFFKQFVNNKYYVHIDNNSVMGTCCISTLKNNLCYICDLKTLSTNKNVTFKFIFKYYFDVICSIKLNNLQLFGIVMQPNKIIDKITTKYWIKKCENLLLYQITYKKYLENLDIIRNIFGEHFFVN